MTRRPQINYRYRRVFHREHPDPPWTCYFCGEEITGWGKHARALSIHHLDHNHTNDVIENLTAAHYGCHMRYHREMADPVSSETRAKLSAARTGWKHSQETRNKIGAGRRGKTHSKEARDKMGIKARGRKASAETRAKMSAARKSRPSVPTPCSQCGKVCAKGGPMGNHLKVCPGPS